MRPRWAGSASPAGRCTSASIIIFSTLWGWFFHEWKGSSRKASTLITSGIAALILSTVTIGVGTWLKGQATGGQ